MKYIAIFEDRKGFTRIAEFAQLPHQYKFQEMQPLSAFAGLKPRAKLDAYIEHTFYPKGEPQEIYGQIIQKYYQKD